MGSCKETMSKVRPGMMCASLGGGSRGFCVRAFKDLDVLGMKDKNMEE